MTVRVSTQSAGVPAPDVAEVGADRDASQAGLQADEPAARRGDADRAAQVAGVGERDHPRGDGGRAPARRATRRELGIPRVPRRAVARVLGDRPHAELGRVRLADDDRAGFAKPAHVRAVVVGDPVAERGAALRRRKALGRRQQILDPDRDAAERVAHRPASPRPPRRARAPGTARRRRSGAGSAARSPRATPRRARVPTPRRHARLPPGRERSARGGRRSPAWRGESTTAPRAYESSRAASRSRSRCTRCITLSSITPSLRSVEQRGVLGGEELAHHALVGGRALLDRAHRRRRRTGARKRSRRNPSEPRRRSAVCGCTVPSSRSSSSRASAASAVRMRALASSRSAPPSSLTSEHADQAGQREPLEDERREDDREREEDDQVALREVARQRERGDERDRAADAGPRDERRVLPRRVRIVLADRAERPPREVGEDRDEARSASAITVAQTSSE